MKATVNTISIILDKRGIDHKIEVKQERLHHVFIVSVAEKDKKQANRLLNDLLDADQFYELVDL